MTTGSTLYLTTPRPTPQQPGPSGPPDRDAHLDNVKAVAIVLVVVGHTLRPFTEAPGALPLYQWIYTFHMPVFVLVSGYLSRSWSGTPAQLRKLVTTLVVPFLVFQAVYQAVLDLVAGRAVTVDLADPEFALWFLMSLALWRLTSPLVRRLRWPLAVALVLSLATGLDDSFGETLSLARTFSLLPFFVAGTLLRREHLERLARPGVRVAAGIVAAGWFAALVVLGHRIPLEWFYWRSGYHELGLRWSQGVLLRCATIVVAAVLTAAFLALVPRRRSVLTAFGAGTMYALVLHGLVLLPMRTWHLYDWIDTLPEVVLAVTAAAAFALALCSGPVRRLTRPFVELPVAERLVRRPDAD